MKNARTDQEKIVIFKWGGSDGYGYFNKLKIEIYTYEKNRRRQSKMGYYRSR